MNYLSDNSYLAIKPESTPGTAVIPTIFVPLVSENIKTIVNYSADQRMIGVDWKSNGLLRGNRMHEGDLVVLGDPDTLGHVINMLLDKGSTTGDSTNGYTHPFTVGTPKSYTIEIKKGPYAQRYFGVHVDELVLDFQDNQLQLTIKIKAMGQVSIGTVGVALSGSVTTLVLNDEYDIAPNRGLVVGDVINVGGVDVTLTSINANGTTVGFSSTSITAAIGSEVYLKPQTVSLPSLQDPFYFGNVLAGVAADATDAATAAASQSTATPIYDLKITFKNNLFAANGSNRLDPVQILPQSKEAQIELKQLFSTVAQRQKWQDRVKQSIVLVFKGKYIKSDFTTQEKFTLTFNNVKLTDDDNEIKVGEYIMDTEKFEVLYDTTDGQAMAAELVNRSAGTVY